MSELEYQSADFIDRLRDAFDEMVLYKDKYPVLKDNNLEYYLCDTNTVFKRIYSLKDLSIFWIRGRLCMDCNELMPSSLEPFIIRFSCGVY